MTGHRQDDHLQDGHLHDGLSALADGEATAEERRAAEIHLARCLDCAAELAATVAIRAVLRGLAPVDSPVPLDVVRTPSAIARFGAALAAVAAAVAVAVLANLNVQPPAPEQVGNLVQVHTTSAVNAEVVSQMAPAAIPVSFQP